MGFFDWLANGYREAAIDADKRAVEEVDAVDLVELEGTDTKAATRLFNQHSMATSRLWQSGWYRDLQGNWHEREVDA